MLDMTPLLPAFGEPAAPGGLLDEPGPAGPDGPIAALAGEKAASGARLELPDGAKVRWAAWSSPRRPPSCPNWSRCTARRATGRRWRCGSGTPSRARR
ncbi:hypothetical protein ACFQZ4_28610 [Catellatospora coxensis]